MNIHQPLKFDNQKTIEFETRQISPLNPTHLFWEDIYTL